ncbi:transposase [Lachnoanaerobaculum orale]|uniref:Transposase n=1 Tax=Lachnoanaerobaculum orale TaxID=979627 RepID=A0A3P3QA27_9FIRM|nr:Rpn family recombination-promoting nuclease/putative transposase [Lachnoanaerobaculum orale]RRJ17223.1 transposase [Lachnoanaerobaculum orale]
MNGKDITQKMLERYNDVFADIVNVLLFNGKRIVDEDVLIDTPVDSALKLDGEIHSQYRDVAKYWKNSQINIALFGLENQTVPDKLMPMRVIGYDGAEYKKQVLEENRYKKKYPVITLVLYMGYEKNWKYSNSLLDLLEVDENLKPYVSDYKINVFEIAFLDREKIDLFKSDFRMLADYLYQMRTTDSYEGDESDIKHVDEILMLMSAMSGFKNVENIIKVAHERKVSNMKGFFELAEEKGIELGREEGADMVSELNIILAREGNLEKIIKANTDKVYRNELLKKYRLLK